MLGVSVGFNQFEHHLWLLASIVRPPGFLPMLATGRWAPQFPVSSLKHSPSCAAYLISSTLSPRPLSVQCLEVTLQKMLVAKDKSGSDAVFVFVLIPNTSEPKIATISSPGMRATKAENKRNVLNCFRWGNE